MGSNKTRHPRESPLVARLVGMETEYATLLANRPDLPGAKHPSSGNVYARISSAIRRDQPTVRGVFDRDQLFLASGAAVSFESHPSLHSLPGGLIEIATPEVASPDELLACQRSIDQLVADAAGEPSDGFDFRVLKNSSDALGHVYGCQENYEAEVARGFGLWVYRFFVLMLWGFQVVSLLAAFPILAISFAAIVPVRIRRRKSQEFTQPARDDVDGPDRNAGDEPTPVELFETLPVWARATLMGMLRLAHFPTVTLLRFVARHVAFRRQRRYLTALLISRVSLCGAGDLDHDGCYRLSPKAMAVDIVSDMGNYDGERPIYVFGHWLGQYCAKSFLSLGSTRSMLNRYQRLQIGLSDSNLSQLAEYVKIGSVSLVLDMIESGQTRDFVIINRPIDALHDIASDWNLVRRVVTNRGRMSALEIQRRYLRAARQFVAQTAVEERGEAELVLERWTELLDVVTAFRRDARNVTPALGRVDWLTKRWMIDQLGSDAEWVTRKKADLRYHELSEDGYYSKLASQNPSLTLIDADRVEKRRRMPPSGSPATKRGWLIREFAGSEEGVLSDWSYAILGEGKNRKRVDFDA